MTIVQLRGHQKKISASKQNMHQPNALYDEFDYKIVLIGIRASVKS